MQYSNRLVVTAALAALVWAPATGPWAQGNAMNMGMMGGADAAEIPRVPPVAGYASGEEVYFIHTEVSDPEIGVVMTEMMDSPVPVVPALAAAPASLLATVYVFTNGLQPDGARGPLGFQPDVFDYPPEMEGYRPLRRIVFVTWSDGAAPRILMSAESVEAAVAGGEATLTISDVVANMPFLTWPGGSR